MSQKTDGHVQYNGGWKFYLTLQPGLACEFTDHRTCKERSHEHDAKLAEAGSEALAASYAEQAARVDAAAAEAATAAQNARIAKAGQRKHEATRQNGLAKAAALAKAEAKCSDALAAAKLAYDSECQRAVSVLGSETEKITKDSVALQVTINVTDYLAEVLAEEAAAQLAENEAKAKAQAEADAAATLPPATEPNKEAEPAAPVVTEGDNAAQP